MGQSLKKQIEKHFPGFLITELVYSPENSTIKANVTCSNCCSKFDGVVTLEKWEPYGKPVIKNYKDRNHSG